jgi:hypothetical protein
VPCLTTGSHLCDQELQAPAKLGVGCQRSFDTLWEGNHVQRLMLHWMLYWLMRDCREPRPLLGRLCCIVPPLALAGGLALMVRWRRVCRGCGVSLLWLSALLGALQQVDMCRGACGLSRHESCRMTEYVSGPCCNVMHACRCLTRRFNAK